MPELSRIVCLIRNRNHVPSRLIRNNCFWSRHRRTVAFDLLAPVQTILAPEKPVGILANSRPKIGRYLAAARRISPQIDGIQEYVRRGKPILRRKLKCRWGIDAASEAYTMIISGVSSFFIRSGALSFAVDHAPPSTQISAHASKWAANNIKTCSLKNIYRGWSVSLCIRGTAYRSCCGKS